MTRETTDSYRSRRYDPLALLAGGRPRWILAPLLALLLSAAGRSLFALPPHGMEERRLNVRLRITGPPGSPGHPVPEKLSDLPALFAAASGQGHTIDGVIPFEPSARLWSDGAFKERYFALPDYAFDPPSQAQISFRPAGGWDFPEHTVVVKNFLLPLDLNEPAGSLRRIETRILLKHEGKWSGYTYEWNEAETDATLLPPPSKPRSFVLTGTDGRPFDYRWIYPGRSECLDCHTAAANRVLGINTPQMNHDYTYPVSGVTENQLIAFVHIGLFDGPLPAAPELLPRMPYVADPDAGLEARARGYLAANCSFCHRPGTEVDAQLDFRWEVETRDLNAINEKPLRGLFRGGGFAAGMRIIAPGRPAASMLLARMRTLDPLYRMPRLGSRRVDEMAVTVLREWIASLATPGPADLEALELPGSTPPEVLLTWTPVSSTAVRVDGYNVYRSASETDIGNRLNPSPLEETSYRDRLPAPGSYYYRVSTAGEWEESPPSAAVVVVAGAGRFLRGDCNGDGARDITDAVFLLHFILGDGGEPSCVEACDASQDAGRPDLADALHMLQVLFDAGPHPSLFPECETSSGDCAGSACPEDGS